MRVSKGFTLLELMVAMAVGSLLLVALFALLRTTSDGYGEVKQRASVERESRAVFYQLEADLRSLVQTHEIRIEQRGGTWPLESLAFLCLKPDFEFGNHQGDLSAVRYYTQILTMGGKPVRCLMRGCDSSWEVFAAIEEGNVGALLRQRRDRDEPMGFGVLEFSLTRMYRDEMGHLVEWSDEVSGDPEWLEVRMVLAKPKLRARLDESDDWDESSWIGDPRDADQHAGLEVYTTRIRMGVSDGSF